MLAETALGWLPSLASKKRMYRSVADMRAMQCGGSMNYCARFHEIGMRPVHIGNGKG